MIKVFLNTNFIKDSLSNKITGDLIHVANIDINNLDAAFFIGQNIEMNWTDSPLVESISKEPQRSVSAGDVFEKDGKKWFIKMIGFEEMPG